jgi:hypothetical protein
MSDVECRMSDAGWRMPDGGCRMSKLGAILHPSSFILYRSFCVFQATRFSGPCYAKTTGDACLMDGLQK